MRKITDVEIAFFDANGYVICPGVPALGQVGQLQGESQRLIDEILAPGQPEVLPKRQVGELVDLLSRREG